MMKLFDFQVNGFSGIDFQADDISLEAMQHAVKALHQHHMTSIFYTLITDDIDKLCRRFERMEQLRAQDPAIASTISGYHLEGPWISGEAGYHGAHPLAKVIPPTVEDYQRIRDAAGGHLKLITLAPEVEGTEAIMEAAVNDSIRIGIGHSNATEEAIDRAIQAGATLITHLGNAVPAEMHRHDNVIQRLLARDELIACLIPDGIHLPPFVLQNFFRAKPAGKVFFTTDCMSAAGGLPGRYQIGPYELEVGEDGIVHLPGDTRFAGSSLTLDRGVENIMEWLNVDREEAIRLCSTHAAEHFGIVL